jgi:hypothetical protein
MAPTCRARVTVVYHMLRDDRDIYRTTQRNDRAMSHLFVEKIASMLD